MKTREELREQVILSAKAVYKTLFRNEKIRNDKVLVSKQLSKQFAEAVAALIEFESSPVESAGGKMTEGEERKYTEAEVKILLQKQRYLCQIERNKRS